MSCVARPSPRHTRHPTSGSPEGAAPLGAKPCAAAEGEVHSPARLSQDLDKQCLYDYTFITYGISRTICFGQTIEDSRID